MTGPLRLLAHNHDGFARTQKIGIEEDKETETRWKTAGRPRRFCNTRRDAPSPLNYAKPA